MRHWQLTVILILLIFLCGCRTATKPVSAVGTVAVKSVEVSGKIAAQTVKTSGKVASQTAKTGISTGYAITRETTKTSSAIVKHQTVFLKDLATGALKEVPWKEGLKLYSATQGADIDIYRKAFTIFRDGGEKVIKTDWNKIKNPASDPPLKPGDYVVIKPVK